MPDGKHFPVYKIVLLFEMFRGINLLFDCIILCNMWICHRSFVKILSDLHEGVAFQYILEFGPANVYC